MRSRKQLIRLFASFQSREVPKETCSVGNKPVCFFLTFA